MRVIYGEAPQLNGVFDWRKAIGGLFQLDLPQPHLQCYFLRSPAMPDVVRVPSDVDTIKRITSRGV